MTAANDAIEKLARDGRRRALIEDIKIGRLDRLPARAREKLPKDVKILEIVRPDAAAFASAFERVPFFLASPLEIALRLGARDVLDELLRRERAKEKEPGRRFVLWTSKPGREVAAEVLRVNDDYLDFDFVGPGPQRSLLALALLLGDYAAARSLSRSGLVPPFWDVMHAIGQISRLTAEPGDAAFFARIYDVPTPTDKSLDEAWNWLKEREDGRREVEEADELEDVAEPGSEPPPRRRGP